MQNLFRGLTKSGKWAYGDHVRKFDVSCIVVFHKDSNRYEEVEVRPETVTRFTGCIDRQGQKIFEQDITKSKGFHSEHSWGLDYEHPKIEVVTGYHFANFIKGSCTSDTPVRVAFYKVIGNTFQKR